MARPHMAQGPANPPLARLCATAAPPPHPLGVQYLIRHHRHRLFVLGAASGAGAWTSYVILCPPFYLKRNKVSISRDKYIEESIA